MYEERNLLKKCITRSVQRLLRSVKNSCIVAAALDLRLSRSFAPFPLQQGLAFTQQRSVHASFDRNEHHRNEPSVLA